MLCNDASAGSESRFKAVIENVDGERCTTDVFRKTFIKGSYLEVSDLGDCVRLQIKEKDAKVHREKVLFIFV